MPSKLTVKHRDLQLSSALDLEWDEKGNMKKEDGSQRLASKNKEERRQQPSLGRRRGTYIYINSGEQKATPGEQKKGCI